MAIDRRPPPAAATGAAGTTSPFAFASLASAIDVSPPLAVLVAPSVMVASVPIPAIAGRTSSRGRASRPWESASVTPLQRRSVVFDLSHQNRWRGNRLFGGLRIFREVELPGTWNLGPGRVIERSLHRLRAAARARPAPQRSSA